MTKPVPVATTPPIYPRKSFRERLDEILIDPNSEDRSWSSIRLALYLFLAAFILLSLGDAEFRDPGAFVTVMLALIGAVVAPKVLDLRMAIGKAAATIGNKWKKETVETTEETELVEDEDEAEPEPRRKPRKPRRGE